MKVHLYPQPSGHADAYIVADPEGLKAIRDACDAALKKGASITEVTAGDGESYPLIVMNVETPDPTWEQLFLPYPLDGVVEAYVGRRVPYEVLGSSRYRELQIKIRTHEQS